MALISIILPSYNEEDNIDRAVDRLSAVLSPEDVSWELVFVNDGSRDHTWDRISDAARRDPHVTGVCFSRNFGKEAAIMAGLACAKGDCCVVMDCDLQHPPETVVEMLHLWQEGYEVVEGIKTSRGKEGFFHKISAGLFYFFGIFFHIHKESSVLTVLFQKLCNFRIIKHFRCFDGFLQGIFLVSCRCRCIKCLKSFLNGINIKHLDTFFRLSPKLRVSRRLHRHHITLCCFFLSSFFVNY